MEFLNIIRNSSTITFLSFHHLSVENMIFSLKKYLYIKWFRVLIKNYKIIFKLVYKLVTNILVNILDYKLVSRRLIDTNLEYKVISS